MAGSFAVANIRDYSLSDKNKGWGNHVLMHEYVHYVMSQMLDSYFYPLWYSEGIAEYFGTFRVENKRTSVHIGNLSVIGNRFFEIQNKAQTRFLPIDVEDLFKTTNLSMGWRRDDKNTKEQREGQKAAGKFYARSLATYHYLQSSLELEKQTEHFIQLMNNGKSIDSAFKMAFGVTYEQMDKAIIEYISSSKKVNVAFTQTSGQSIFPEVTVSSRHMTAEQVYSEIAMKLAAVPYYQPHEIEMLASTVKARGLKSEAREVFLLDQQTVLSSEDVKQQIAQVNDALKIYPDSAELIAIKAQLYYSRAYWQFRFNFPDVDEATADVRTLARQALKINFSNGRAYWILGRAAVETYQTHPQLLYEASMALDSAKLILSDSYLQDIVWREFYLYTLMNQPEKALQALRQYSILSDDKWLSRWYGRLVWDALELRAIAVSSGRVEGDKIIYGSDANYVGNIKNGLPEGKGILTRVDGASFEGHWIAGVLQGQGVFKSSNGYVYEGQIKDGLLSGKAKLTYPVKHKFISFSEGDFLMGMEHGQHRIFFKDGRVFEGGFHVGREHGKGQITLADKSIKAVTFVDAKLLEPIGDNTIFSGARNKNYQASGEGMCYSKILEMISPCKIVDGKIK